MPFSDIWLMLAAVSGLNEIERGVGRGSCCDGKNQERLL
jgi:hypothetical protein